MSVDAWRKLQAAYMPDRAIVQRRAAATSDDAGGQTPGAWGTIKTTCCRINSAGRSAMEQAIAEQYRNSVTVLVIMPWNTGVEITDRLLVNGVTYDVAGLLPAAWGTVEQVVAVQHEH